MSHSLMLSEHCNVNYIWLRIKQHLKILGERPNIKWQEKKRIKYIYIQACHWVRISWIFRHNCSKILLFAKMLHFFGYSKFGVFYLFYTLVFTLVSSSAKGLFFLKRVLKSKIKSKQPTNGAIYEPHSLFEVTRH